MTEQITIPSQDLSKYIQTITFADPVSFEGNWQAHILGDCPECGGALTPYSVTVNDEDPYVALMCSQQPAHTLGMTT